MHWSFVHGLLSLAHVVPRGWKVSAGQAALAFEQLSARSQAPLAARQTLVRRRSAPQVLLVPLQVSATSHTPADARHTVADDEKLLLGQVFNVPLQTSCGSHTPADARHTFRAWAFRVDGERDDDCLGLQFNTLTQASRPFADLKVNG